MKRRNISLAVLFTLCLCIIGFNAIRSPRFSLPEKTLTPYEMPTVSSRSAYDTGKININTADMELLQTLPGIGEKLAQTIIDYRENVAHFSSRRDIMNVSGIGEKKYEQLKDLIVT